MDMSSPTEPLATLPLDTAPTGSEVRISAIDAPRPLRHRLLGLGLHPGESLRVLQRRGTGLVLAVGASRVALDLRTARLLEVEILRVEAIG